MNNFKVDGELHRNTLKLRLTFRGKYQQNLELWEEEDYYFIAEISAMITNQGFYSYPILLLSFPSQQTLATTLFHNTLSVAFLVNSSFLMLTTLSYTQPCTIFSLSPL